MSDCFNQHGCGHGIGTWQKRSIALPAIPPIGTVLRLDHHVCARETDRWRASGFVGFEFAAAAGSFLLEHALAIVAGMDAQVRLFEDERHVVPPHLLACAAAEPRVAGDDAFTHLAAELPCGK